MKRNNIVAVTRVEEIGDNIWQLTIDGFDDYWITFYNFVPGELDGAYLQFDDEDMTQIDITEYVPYNPTISSFGEAMLYYLGGKPVRYREPKTTKH